MFFLDDYAHPWKEFKNSAYITCDETHDSCILELYCCEPEPISQSDCATGEELKTASCTSNTDSRGGYWCSAEGLLESDIPYEQSSFKYCKAVEGCTGSPITCWRSDCSSSRTYNCDYFGYPNCPSSYPYKAETKSECEALMPEETCSELGTDMNACFDRTDCIWTRFSNCKTIQDAQCTGMREKDCLQGSGCEWTGTACQTKPTNGNGDTIEMKVATLSDLRISKTKIEQKGSIIVSGKVKNNLDSSQRYLLEIGIIPTSVADNWGFKYETATESKRGEWALWKKLALVSFLFATIETGPELQCVEGQDNINDFLG